ncbi:J domain-containing protein [Balneatrix alpica]|uniref:J domain-containing protein n=1 Tax=Balneatrix alpica TaxID=75684 RepID=A0ABV5ZEK0_9GAMM|nr:hypothetical protein [Balneatrix alpica]
MPLIYLILFLVVAAWLWQTLRRLPPQQRRKRIGLVLLSLLGALVVVLALTGRLPLISAAIGVVLPWLARFWPTLLKWLFVSWRKRQQTNRLIQLQHDANSGELRGMILHGPWQGRELASLNRDEFATLLQQCQQQDPLSAALMRQWWHLQHGQAWDQPPPGQASSQMDEEQARAILGLGTDWTVEQVEQAYKRLIGRLHPDKGGSDWLASRINEARDWLIQHSKRR